MDKQKILGSSLLITGTCIGAGMLVLPVAMSPLGFYFSSLVLIAVCCMMCFTGLLVLEANLWLPENTSYISMAQQTLGKPGKILTWVLFLFLLYALLTAYILGGGSLVIAVEEFYLQYHMQPWLSYLPWIIAVGYIIYSGIHLSDLLNRLLMLGLILTFAILATGIGAHVKVNSLDGVHWPFLLISLPVIFAAFGYHIIVPSLRDYLKSQTAALRWIVILGSVLTLLLYLLWAFLIFGTLPVEGKQGLFAILKSHAPANLLMQVLSDISQHAWLNTMARFFVFFAIASSFVGVAIGLFDFLADGLKIDKKTKLGRLILISLTFVPPLMFVLIYPLGFIKALGYAGALVAILHGLLPALMVWSGRYVLKISKGYRVWGGKALLLFMMFLSLLVVFIQVSLAFNWFPRVWLSF